MNRTLSLLALAFAGAVLVVGCADANDKFIQGTWYYKDAHLNSISGETFLEIDWTFAGGSFELYSCCFNGRIHQTGRYRIKESDGDVITLELFNIKGGGTRGPAELQIVIDREADTLSIQGAQGFTRKLSLSR